MSIAPVNPVFEVKLSPLGDTAIIVELGSAIDRKTHERVQALRTYLQREPFPGFIELVPAYATLTIFYDPMKLLAPLAENNWNLQAEAAASPYEWVCQLLTDMVSKLEDEQAAAPRIVTLPVCYGGELGPDLAAVAEHSGLSEKEVIALHGRSLISYIWLVLHLVFLIWVACLGDSRHLGEHAPLAYRARQRRYRRN